VEIDQIARTAKLMSLPLAFGGRAVAGLGRRLAGADRAEVSATTTARNAEQLFAVLGRLKGGAMKIGQALSVFDTMVPEEIAEPYHEALSKLQSSAPAMPEREPRDLLPDAVFEHLELARLEIGDELAALVPRDDVGLHQVDGDDECRSSLVGLGVQGGNDYRDEGSDRGDSHVGAAGLQGKTRPTTPHLDATVTTIGGMLESEDNRHAQRGG